MAEWNYGDAYKRYPVTPGEEIHVSGGILMAHDIFNPLPDFMKKADVIFTDSPWNLGNMRSFYTKADQMPPDIAGFTDFYRRLFECIAQIRPKECYLEIGKEFLGEYLTEMKKLYKNVTFYNSTYYHRQENLCYVVQGGSRKVNRHYDGMDEEDIISAVARDTEGVLGDLCMGRGLVAVAAVKNGRSFVGTELNPKRLAVCLERLDGLS